MVKSNWMPGIMSVAGLMLAFLACQPQAGTRPNGPDNGGVDEGPPGGDIDVRDISGPAGDVNPAIDVPRFALGHLALPSGVGLSPGQLRVVTAAQEWPVQPDGVFNATTYSSSYSLVAVVNQNDRVVLLGLLLPGTGATLSVKTTAAVLVHFALGGWSLPSGELFAYVNDLIELQVCQDVADVIAAEMARDPLVVANGSAAVDAAVVTAVAAIESRDALPDLSGLGVLLEPRSITPGEPFLIVSPTAPQSGVTLILDRSAPRITARNGFRRPAKLYRLLTGYNDAGGGRVDLPVVELVGEPIDLPGGETLRVRSGGLNSMFGTVTATPWLPSETGPIEVPARDGATRTYYDLVAIGPSFDGSDSPLLDRSRYAAIRSEWENLLIEQRIDTFVLKFMMPLAETFAVGVRSSIPLESQPPVVRTLRELIQPILDGAGIRLNTLDGYVAAVDLILDRWSNNRAFREDLIAVLIAAYGTEIGARLDSIDISVNMRRLARTASLRGAIKSAFGMRDVARLADNLGQADDIVVWTAEVGAVRITPSPGLVSEDFPFVELTASVRGTPALPLSYQWSTAADFGRLSTVEDEPAEELTTTEATVLYMADPAEVLAREIDQVTVRVSDANGALLGSATVGIEGTRKEDNPCPEFVAEHFQRGSALEVNVSSNVVRGGQDVYIDVGYHFASPGSRTVEVFMSAACPRCQLLCQCGNDKPIFVDGETAVNRREWFALRWQSVAEGQPDIQMRCAASGQWTFRQPEGASAGVVSHTFKVTIADDWPGCPTDQPGCGCPRLRPVIVNAGGEEDPRVMAWRGYFLVVTVSPGNERHVQALDFDTNPLWESLATCPED